MSDTEGLYEHYSQAPWEESRWPNFSPAEMACRHCGEYYHFIWMLDAIQTVRRDLNRPVNINSAHRCPLHNASAAINGSALSQHKVSIAFDISIGGHTPLRLYQALRSAGFDTFGAYGSFIHVDARKGRRWATPAGRKIWGGIISGISR